MTPCTYISHHTSVVVQFYPWFKFSFLLFQTHYHVIIIHYHTQKQKTRKFEPRINLNHNTSLYNTIHPFTSPYIHVQHHALLYITIHPYTSPYISTHLYTSPYIHVQYHAPLYITIYLYYNNTLHPYT